MDELEHKSITETVPGHEPGEVVLRYDAPSRTVVERYVHPDPLPGRRETPPAPLPEPPEPSAPEARRGHRGLWLFLLCVALLLAPVLERTLLSRALDWALHRDDDFTFRYEYRAEDSARQTGETTIVRYPGDGDVRLRFSEERGEPLTIQQIYQRVNPCTVTVATALSDSSAVVGTGVIFTEDGYILTNAHVIQGGSEAFAVLDDGTVLRNVKLVGMDEANDLAVLKAEAEGLPVAEFGDSDALTVGDTVYAIGNPLGIELRGTLTDGIVSAINRDVNVDGVTMTLIQTNAALNHGNSGGPLINVYGQVVGVNTMKMGKDTDGSVSVEGLGFAIPVSSAAWVVDDLIAYGEKRGEPVLGILVEAGALPTGESAVFVRSVERDSACDRAGIRAGDAIVSAEGVTMEQTGDLLRVRRRFRAGESMTLEIERDGVRMRVDVTLQAAS